MKSALSSFMVLAIGTALAMAAEPPGGRSSELADQLNSYDQQITKVYRVSDLVLPAPDYAFNGVHLPGAGPFRRREASSGGGGYMGEMGGGGMGGGGGGMGGMGGIRNKYLIFTRMLNNAIRKNSAKKDLWGLILNHCHESHLLFPHRISILQ